MTAIFWISIFVIVYTFVGYGFVLYALVRLRRLLKGERAVPAFSDESLPTCTLVVAAYNEEDFIDEKIKNTLQLIYPAGKLEILFITDGSSDRTPEIIGNYPQIRLMHSPERKGKIAAVHRAVGEIISETIVFTDANTFLNREALLHLCRHYSDAAVGAVAGEKRILMAESADASAAGEGFYWKYESRLKTWDSELHSVVGAAGELFSVRTSLYSPVSPDSIIDDFMISMLIARKGFRIIYEPEAYAVETASENVAEELKRKVRIAAGGMQSIVWLASLLNIFRYGTLSFQYISHRVLRWSITPFLLILVLLLNVPLAVQEGGIYALILVFQVIFYSLSLAGRILENRNLRVKVLFIPYYFCLMNYAVIAGIVRYFRRKQSAAWEKSRRKS